MIYEPGTGKGYVYLMRKDELQTYRRILRLKGKLIDRRILTKPEPRGEINYWGWMRFDRPLPLYDAMEAGLVPIFREGGQRFE